MKEIPALKIEKLKKTYSNGLLALDGISLEVEAGRFLVSWARTGRGRPRS